MYLSDEDVHGRTGSTGHFSPERKEAVHTPVDLLKKQAEVFLEKGKRNKAKACYQLILARERLLRDVEPRDLFEVLSALGEISANKRQWRAATRAFERALHVAEQQIGVISAEAATTLSKLARIYQTRAEIRASREVMSTTDWDHVYWGHQVRTYWQGAYRRSSEAGAAQYYRERHQIIEALVQEPVEYPESIAILYTAARLAADHNTASAAEYCREAYQECLRDLGATHPHTLDLYALWRAYTATAVCTYANEHIDSTMAMAKAEQAIAEVQQVMERIGQVNRKELFNILAVIGYCYARHKRYDEAQPLFEEELTVAETADAPDTFHLTFALCDLAQCAYYQGGYDEAEQYDLRALAIREKKFAKQLDAAHLHHLVLIYEKQGNKQDLIEQTRERLKLIGESFVSFRCYRFGSVKYFAEGKYFS
jgi:tetratricopeptide (TPR) repeat protein